MASTQRGPTARRRSARHAFDAEDQHHDEAPAGKRARKDAAAEANGTGKQQANGTGKGAAGRKARAAAYDEDDDGFTFSRTRSKKTTAAKKAVEPAPAPAPAKAARTAHSAADAHEAADEPAKRRTRKSLAAMAPAVAEEVAPKRRRSARLSGDQQQQEVSTPAPAKPKRARKSAVQRDRVQTPKNDDDEGLALVGEAGRADAEQPSREGTKIALPFSDTPIIKRNKEMRKGGGGSGHRRSSTGLRGRRASSLIDSGTSNGGQHLPGEPGQGLDDEANSTDGVAVPHAEVPTEDFYKLIEQSLPEPRRMKQLLTWCGTRALPDKPSGEVKDLSAIMAARAIQQELLNDFASKNEMSNWFNREDAEPAVLIKKPNPRNEENAKKLEELEQEVKRISQTDLEARLQAITASLEPRIDLFADGLHKVVQYRGAAERVADRILGSAAERLEERDREAKKAAGTENVGSGDVLRALAGVLSGQGRR
ncbi:mis12-mtw1 family protein [Neofusicoccum parvum]|uniref:Mis12-mtw1 family protein n=1 Tax=Neofusicoccum parvum TaxID=310453 RepID=A0ACB5SF45_9PEZI|nr:mis12-mtw1 family protein [Neofusicoccum parvum]